MSCHEIRSELDEYLDRDLPGGRQGEIAQHLAGCASCRQELARSKALREELRTMVYEPPSASLMRESMASAMKRGRRRERRIFVAKLSAMAAAIALLLSISLASTSFFSKGGGAEADLTISLHEQKTVSLLVDAREAMAAAEITIDLPSQLSLAGFPEQRRVSWRSDLQAGKNILKLPLVATSEGQGTISTRIDHNDRQKVMHLLAVISGPA
ncbi:MAG: zf-HC2 domain-containing protein [Thermodesulfobacteriota bacterium]